MSQLCAAEFREAVDADMRLFARIFARLYSRQSSWLI